MRQKIQAVVFDWAGTIIDYGCFAPMHAFIGAFEREGIAVTHEEVRKPMGLLKKDHIREILKMERVGRAWLERFDRLPEERDVEVLYGHFEELLMESLHQFTAPVPGALGTVTELKSRGIKIGSTTGYTKQMMEVVAPGAKQHGYEPDFLVCADEVPEGRPHPHMIRANMKALGVDEPRRVVKVGDTISDVQEGKNAGTWTIAVLFGSSELGLTEEEAAGMDEAGLDGLKRQTASKFMDAGADYVIDSIGGVPDAIDAIEAVMREERADEPVL